MLRDPIQRLLCVCVLLTPVSLLLPAAALGAAPRLEMQGRSAGASVVQRIAPGDSLASGDGLRLRVTASDDGYLYVVALGSSGAALMLQPFDGAAPAWIGAGESVAVPGDGGYLPLDDRPGVETFLAFVTPTPLASTASLLVRLEGAGGGEVVARQVLSDAGHEAAALSVNHVAPGVATASPAFTSFAQPVAGVAPATGDQKAVLSGLGSRIAGFTSSVAPADEPASVGDRPSAVASPRSRSAPAPDAQPARAGAPMGSDAGSKSHAPQASGGILSGVARLFGFGAASGTESPAAPAEVVKPASTYALAHTPGPQRSDTPAGPPPASGDAALPAVSTAAAFSGVPVGPAPPVEGRAPAAAAVRLPPASPVLRQDAGVTPAVPEPAAAGTHDATPDSRRTTSPDALEHGTAAPGNLPPVEVRKVTPAGEAGLFAALGSLLGAGTEAPVVQGGGSPAATVTEPQRSMRATASVPAPATVPPEGAPLAPAAPVVASTSPPSTRADEPEPGAATSAASGAGARETSPRTRVSSHDGGVRDVTAGDEPALIPGRDASGRDVVRLQGARASSGEARGNAGVLSGEGSRIRALLDEPERRPARSPAGPSEDSPPAPSRTGTSGAAAAPLQAALPSVPAPGVAAAPQLAELDLSSNAGPAASVVMVITPEGIASGVLIDTSGHVLTSWHGVEGNDSAVVAFKREGGTRAAVQSRRRAHLVAHSKFSDLALLKVEALPEGYPAVVLADVADPLDGAALHTVAHGPDGTWQQQIVHDARVRPNSSWYSPRRVLHRAHVIRAEVSREGPILEGPLFNERLELVGLGAMVRRDKGELIGVSTATLKAFLDEPG